MRTQDGLRVDLRNIKSPIIVFCSLGDDITPPQQALGWITDLYDHEDEIVATGQTIVYCLHQSIGHLGIFVSGTVATKEHGEFAQAMDMIDLMPPGLYEAVISGIDGSTEHPELVKGKYLFTLERRTVADIRALVGNSPEDDRCFAAVARLSEINQGLYRTVASPLMRQMSSEQSAELLRSLHPNRMRFHMFADDNPMMMPVAGWAQDVRANRRPVSSDNPFFAFERLASRAIADSLEAWGKARDALTEQIFLSTYGSAWLQALLGLRPDDASAGHRVERDLVREAAAGRMAADLRGKIEAGGLAEAAVRALLYVRLPDGTADERGFAMLQQIAEELPAAKRLGLTRFKELVKEQFLILRLDAERAVAALPKLMPDDRRACDAALRSIHRVIEARGALSADAGRRLAQIDKLFGESPTKSQSPRQPEMAAL